MRAAGSGWRGGASCCLGRRLTGGERRAGGREADKHLRGDLWECRIQSSKLLCQSTQEQGLGAGQRRAEFAMLNTLVGVGSEELSHSARHAGGPALRELLVWEGRPRWPGPRGQSTTGGWVRTDRRCGGRDETRGTERKRGFRSVHSAHRVRSFTLTRKRPHEVGCPISIFASEETESQGMKGLGHGHTTGNWQSQDKKPGAAGVAWAGAEEGDGLQAPNY